MRTLRYLLPLALLFGTLAAPAAAQTRGFDVQRPAGQPAATGIRRALIVGVDDYQDPSIPQLRYAATDALAFAGWLRSPASAAGVDTIVVLLNAQAGRDAVMKHYRDLVALTQPGDELIVYFSGHGGVRQVHASTEGYLLPHDAVGADMALRGISLDDINKEVGYLRGQSPVLLILDACRSGNLFNANLLSQAAESLGGSVRRLVSSEGGQDSLEGAQWEGHGAFTYFLLNGLYGMADANRDGNITLAELGLWVVDRVATETNQAQVPQVQPFDHKWVITEVVPAYSDSVARSVAARGGGAPTTAMRSTPPAASRPAQPAPAAAAAGAGGRALRLGQQVAGELQRSAPTLEDGTHYDAWSYHGRRGERISFTMRSSQFDPFLIVARERPDGTREILRQDDDGAGGTDARISMEIPEDGEYAILANGISVSDLGAYTIEVAVGTTVETSFSEIVAAAPGLPVIRLGDGVSGRLADDSPIYIDRTPFVAYSFEGRAGQTLEIEMRAADFDAYLVLGDVAGDSILARDDDSLGGTDAFITARLPADGRYVVMANAIERDARGAFSLRLAPGRPTHGIARVLADAAGATRRIAPGETVRGRLADSSPALEDRSLYEVWSYAGRAGETITITLRSDEFDAYLGFGRAAPGGSSTLWEQDDDSGGGHDAQLTVTLPEDGLYAVVANAYRPGARGAFTLEVRSGSAPAAAGGGTATLSLLQLAALAMQPGAPTLAPGGSLDGTLTEERRLESDDTPVLPVLLRGTPGERVAITLSSTSFDSYLMVLDASGGILAQDDDGAGGRDARVTIEIPSSGTCVVLVNSYEGGSGSFTVRAERVSGVRRVAAR